MRANTNERKPFIIRQVQKTPYKHTYATSALEFSKVIVKRTMWLFSIQTTLSILVIFLKPESGNQITMLMSAVVPFYAIILGGYFGKAGLENFQKIKNEGLECESNHERYDTNAIG